MAREAVANSVPFVDLGAIHAPLKDSLLLEIEALIESGAFANGPAVGAFEDEFAAACGTAHCIGVSSGLDALRLTLQAAGLREDDRVAVPALTFIASYAAVTQGGGVPVPVEIDESDYNISADALDAALDDDRLRFVMPVHLYGQMTDMRRVASAAARRQAFVLEDACQAHGASRDGIRPGQLGDAAAFSFYPGKNLGAMGDAGAVVTGDEGLAGLVRSLREHGQREKYRHEQVGWTARLDTIQAVVLRAKLPHLEAWNEDRRGAAAIYNDALDGVGDLTLPPVAPGSTHAWHLYVIRTQDPAALAAHLRELGIATGRHYPEPPHLSHAYEALGYRAGAFPVAERVARECLSLPIYGGIEDWQAARVAEAVRSFFE